MSYTFGMKTAISIKDNLFQKAEKFAAEEKISRSQLYSEAIEEYLEKRNKDKLIAKINEVCEKVDTSLDPVIRQYQSRKIKREKW